MAKTFTKAFFMKMSNARYYKWLRDNAKKLAGSCIATKSNINLSGLICRLTKKRSVLGGFIPSHIGSIVIKNDTLFLFNMKPPKASKVELSEYLRNTEEDYVLVLRDFELDTAKFSEDILKEDGRRYAYLSAFQTAFKAIEWLPNIGEHCSELHAHFLQKQGYLKGVHCDNLTPVETYEMLVCGIRK